MHDGVAMNTARPLDGTPKQEQHGLLSAAEFKGATPAAIPAAGATLAGATGSSSGSATGRPPNGRSRRVRERDIPCPCRDSCEGRGGVAGPATGGAEPLGLPAVQVRVRLDQIRVHAVARMALRRVSTRAARRGAGHVRRRVQALGDFTRGADGGQGARQILVTLAPVLFPPVAQDFRAPFGYILTILSVASEFWHAAFKSLCGLPCVRKNYNGCHWGFETTRTLHY